ncbi:MAG: C25 family cysteine peptidase [Phycisphaerales bacterium]
MTRFAKRIRSVLCVSAVVATTASVAARHPSLLIVAPHDFASALAPFVEFKQDRLGAELVSLESVLAATGENSFDDAERLKRYLYDRWRESDGVLRFVLLVGDADVLPVRYMTLDRVTEPAFHYAFYPSDLYYADLAKPDGAFEDWNARRDDFHAAYFGEVRGEHFKADPINFDAVDYRPEVAVGRWPVSAAEDAARVAAKSMVYERGVEAGEAPTLGRAVFLATDGWIENRPLLDRQIEHLSAGWSVERRYFRDDARDDGTPPASVDEVVRLFNAGVGLVVHSGHGSDDLWDQSLASTDLATLENADRLPVVVSAGCSTARFATLPPYEGYVDIHGVSHAGTNHGEVFDAPPPPPACYQSGAHNPTGLGERLVRDAMTGAVAYIGCNTGSQPCGMTLVEGFVAAIDDGDSPRLGECWSRAVANYYDAERLAELEPTESWYPASIFFQGMKFMLFGDPSLPMPRPIDGNKPPV